jgi:hypothetical protein
LIDPPAQEVDLFLVSVFPDSGGGMCSSGSSLVMCSTSALSAALPGTMIPRFVKAPSSVSKWKRVFRAFSSGPWQAKQLFERIGRISRLKLTGGSGLLAGFLDPQTEAAAAIEARARKHQRANAGS